MTDGRYEYVKKTATDLVNMEYALFQLGKALSRVIDFDFPPPPGDPTEEDKALQKHQLEFAKLCVGIAASIGEFKTLQQKYVLEAKLRKPDWADDENEETNE